MRIGILNSGGDCPGLNAVIHGVTGAANQLGWEVIGFRDGFEGLLPPGDFMVLDRRRVQGIMKLGGTILGTVNKGNFAAKKGAGDVAEVAPETIAKAKATLKLLELGALVVVGGDGSLTTALQLYRAGIPIIGVPKTIDNDLKATASTFGFDSAVTSVVDALDRLHTTAASHKRVFVLETMGRHAGWIALYGGIGGGANVILLPEIPFDFEVIAAFIREREATGQHATLIVAAEGAFPTGGLPEVEAVGCGGEYRLGGIGDIVMGEIARRTGKDVRCCTLGHLQRGGAPTSLDRVLATRFGVMAVKLIAEGRFGRMVSYESYRVDSVPIEDAVRELKTVDPEGEIVAAARAIGVCFGD